jgi:hypothetical protein
MSVPFFFLDRPSDAKNASYVYAVVLPLLIGNTNDSGDGFVSFELVDRAGDNRGEGVVADACTAGLEL